MKRPIQKIVIIGGESTGKSTLSAQLAAHYQTDWVPEFARHYLEKLKTPYTQTDLLAIAKGQVKSEIELMKTANKYLFCDTDLYVMQVWSEHKYQTCDTWILNQIAQQQADAYILTSPDMPWEPDPQREHPEPKWREYFFNWYKKIVEKSALPFTIVSGNEEMRLQQAIDFIENMKS